MIRALIEQTFDSTKKYLVLFGLSTDSKPVSGLITGSEFHEVNTGVKYEFDEVNSQWHEVGITEQEIKDEIDAWLDDHPEATTTVEDGAISYAKLDSSLKGTVDDVADLKTEIQTKANVDGSYSSLTAGNAEQLISTVGVTEQIPYLFRTTGGSADVGDRVKVSEITGGTVAWNQFVDKSKFEASTTISDVTFTNNGDGSISVSGLASAVANYTVVSAANYIKILSGHKVLFSGISGGGINNYAIQAKDSANGTYWITSETIFALTGDNLRFNIYVWSGANVNFTVKPQIFDLTAMFGKSIADYLYTLESATPGTGIAKLKSWGFCTKPYYAYNAGSLLSVKTSAHNEYGFNAYNPSTGIAKVVGGQVYQITGTYTALSLDGTSITPDASGYFTPAESGELTVTGGNSTDTCIHLKWDGERDGEYEPYEVNTYALDSDLELRGIPKLDANNNLFYDGDGYAPDGTVTRRYGIVDLGTKTWNKLGTGFYSNAISDILPGAASVGYNHILCPRYTSANVASMAGLGDKECSVDSGKHIQIKDSAYTDEATLKTSLSGVYLVYELATPTTESADPYQEVQGCNDFGTEEFVDERTLKMPVCANALYQANLRAKLEMAPASPSGNGKYIVQQTDGMNEYVLLEKELPTAPAEDGTYTLKCTVASGTATLSWVADA